MRHIKLVLLLVVTGCQLNSNASDLKRVDHNDVAPTNKQTYTDARVISLNKWAEELLSSKRDGDDFQTMANAYFAKAKITDAEPLSRYTLSLRPGKECFSDSDHDLWWTNHKDKIKLQLESAAQFIFEFHKTMYGKPTGPFAIREVEICPVATTKRKLHLVGEKLIIGVPTGYWYDYVPMTSDELLAKWNSAEQFVDDRGYFTKKFTESKFKKLWLIFNPIGYVRTGLRQTLSTRGERLAQLLDSWIARKVVSKADIISEFLDGKNTVSLQMLPKDYQDRITDPQKLLKDWAAAARSKRNADELSIAALGLLNNTIMTEKNDISVDIRAGLVAIGNYHRIGVNFAATGGPSEQFVQNISQRERITTVNAKVYSGLVSVFTIDDINVDAAIAVLTESTNHSIETASFYYALQQQPK